MARARDPNRDKAFELFVQHKGEITNRAIAEQLDVLEKTISAWKSRDRWLQKLNGDDCSTTKKECSTTNKKTLNKSKKKVVESEEIVFLQESEDDEFTDKQRLFIAYYVKYWNATKAYQKAYECAYTTARNEGARLLANPCIREEIIRVRDGLTNDALLDKRTLIQKWIDIAFADITDYLKFGRQEEIEYQEDGQPALDMNGNVKTYAFNYVHLNDSTDIDGSIVTEVKQGKDGITVKLADKMKALDFLSKHMDLLNENERKQLQVEQLKYKNEAIRMDVEKQKREESVGSETNKYAYMTPEQRREAIERLKGMNG